MEVLAELALLDDSGDPFSDRARRFARLRRQVTREDHVAYYGTDQTGGKIARALLVSQASKTWGTAKWVGGAAASATRRPRG